MKVCLVALNAIYAIITVAMVIRYIMACGKFGAFLQKNQPHIWNKIGAIPSVSFYMHIFFENQYISDMEYMKLKKRVKYRALSLIFIFIAGIVLAVINISLLRSQVAF